MPYIIIENFAAGLDTRRHPMMAPPGSLRVCQNGHITRGGEVSKRRAAVPWKDVAGTKSLAALGPDTYVFGEGPRPGGLDAAIQYQQLVDPTGGSALDRVLSYDIFDGKLYVAAAFTDGTIAHFYDGVLVTDWFDGRARGSFKILGGTASAGVKASGTFEITVAAAGGSITAVRVGSITDPNQLTAAVPFNTDIATTAANVAANINANGAALYTAEANGGVIRLIDKDVGVTNNGKALVISKAGTAAQMTVANVGVMSGGVATSQVTGIKVNGVEIMSGAVVWTTDNETTAQAIVANINAFTSAPDYTAEREGTKVTLVAVDPGADANSYSVEVSSSGDISIIPSQFTLAGGFNATEFVPGSFVKTVQTKEYSTSGSVLHFSGVEEPTQWKTDVTGAGFINMANQDGQSQQLLAMERYYNGLAVFSRRNVQIWSVDVDPAQNVQKQVLRNTGLVAPLSVEQFGDNDVFYLSDSGVRSLRARDSSTAAAVNDIGTPVDEIIVAAMQAAGPAVAARAVAIIEPVAGRYWLALGSTVYVYTQFPGSKISAWSSYDFGFPVEEMALLDDGIVIRSGDDLYLIGGETGAEYDDSLLVVELPLLDVQKPAHFKTWSALDLVIVGEWRVYAGFEPLNPDARELIATINAPSLSMQRVPLAGYGTHASVRLECDQASEARLCSYIMHYELADVG